MAVSTPTGTLNAKELAEIIKQTGNIQPGQGNNQQGNPMQQMMWMAMAKNASPAFMAGGLVGRTLGKLFEGAFNDWKEKYNLRGVMNAKLDNAKTPEEREAILNKLIEEAPSKESYFREHYNKRYPQAVQPTQEATGNDTPELLLGNENQEAVRQAFANAQMPQNVQGLLGQISQRNGYSPQQGTELNAPFENLPLSLDFWQQLKQRQGW